MAKGNRSLSYSEISSALTCEVQQHPLAAKRALIAEARRLRAADLSFARIAKRLNTTPMTAWQWCQPDYEPQYISRTTPFAERLVPRLVRPALGPCLEWQGGRDSRGYGAITIDGKKTKAHRYAYELNCGPIPTGRFVCHRCDNPPCCEPTHLYAGTPSDNARDAARAGKLSRGTGEHSVFCKFSDDHIAQARQLRSKGWLLSAIADELGIEVSYVSRICRGEVRP